MRSGITARLVALVLVLVLLAVGAVAVSAEALLRRMAEEQALARVALAADAARDAIARMGRDATSESRLLAQRPTLLRLMDSGETAALAEYLETYQEGGGSAGCALLDGGRPVAESVPSLPWESMHPEDPDAATGGLYGGLDGELFVVGVAAVPDRASVRAAVARRLDQALLGGVSAQAGVPVSVVTRRDALAAYGDGRARLLAGVAAGGARGAVRSRSAGAYCAVVPLLLASGSVGAVLEAKLPTAEVDRSIDRMRRRIATVALVVVGVAALASVLAARRLAGPVAELTDAASRLGRGDLRTPVIASGPGELGSLAAVMEEMRARLLALTAEIGAREAESAAILEGISEGVLAVDLDRRVRYLNPQAASMLGVTLDAAAGRHCGELLHPRLAPEQRPCQDRCPIVHARSSGRAQAVEHLALAQGTRTAVVASAATEGSRQVVLLRDETEAEAGRRMRDAILANLSHELRTPLSAQLASLEMLQERLAAGTVAEATELAGSLERGTFRLTRLIDNLLESVRIEAGHRTMRSQELFLDEIVEEAMAQTLALIRQRGQSLDVELPAPLPAIVGDRPRLVQVMVNLLANANKYAPEGSTIRIGGSVGEREVAIWVENAGAGLPAGGSEQLFRPFVRAFGSEPSEAGAGLGLWVVRSIVERHGGSVEALDTGSGARFTVRLPREAATAPRDNPAP